MPRFNILLRSSWQTGNIGDIGHTPGVLALLEKYVPDAQVCLWPISVKNGVEAMLMRRFPTLRLVQTQEEVAAAFIKCDFLLHGSGPDLVGRNDVARWKAETGKPYGVYGITLVPEKTSLQVVELLSAARFVFLRDSVSLQAARKLGVTCPIMEFGPDGAFAADVRDDAKALHYLREHELEAGHFLCCIPRWHRTPRWKMPSKREPFNAETNELNEAMKERDHAELREAVVQVVRQTTLKVLLCPEDETQMELGREIIYEKLPTDVQKRVVWRDRYWLTDEALSTYVHSAGLFGNEMHSPIMCVGNGIPALVCRWGEQTSKGFMWRDIGLSDWLFDLDTPGNAERVVPAVLDVARHQTQAHQKVEKARAFVRKRQQETMAVLRATLQATEK